MNDEKMLEKIRSSAEHIDVPERLEPESVEERLSETEEPARRSSVRSIAAAAAAFVLCICVWGIAGRPLSAEKKMAAQMTTEAEQSTKDQPAENSDAGASSDDGNSETAIAGLVPIGDYRELYDALQEIRRQQETDYAVAESEDSGGIFDGFFSNSAAVMESSEKTMAADAAGAPADTGTGSYSATNTQTEGVDEGDVVKTDGAFIYILKQSQGVRIVQADVMEEVCNLSLPNYNEYVEDMYVTGGRLVLIASGTSSELVESGDAAYSVSSHDATTVYTYDVSDPANTKLIGQMSQDGYYRDSRISEDYLYLFTDYAPGEPEKPSAIEEYVPIVGSGAVPRDNIFIPEKHESSNSLVISSVKLSEPDAAQDCKSVLSGADNFYVSGEHIFIVSTSWDDVENTQIISFAYTDGEITPRAAGSVRGYLNDQFSLDEYDRHLRVVATYVPSGETEERNCLYVLDEDLNITGKIDDLAPGETIRSARFFGDTGYFVTFRQMDPLFSVDLSDPANPTILGELKITGFSDYLHFYDENLLLGIGWEIDPDTGENLGMKLSMFDISDPVNVKEKDKFVIKDIYDCPATDNHKAVMIDPGKNLFGFAYAGDGSGRTDSSYSLFSYDKEKGFAEQFTCSLNEGAGPDSYTDIWNVRGLYINDDFYLATENSLTKFDMKNDFASKGKLSW